MSKNINHKDGKRARQQRTAGKSAPAPRPVPFLILMLKDSLQTRTTLPVFLHYLKTNRLKLSRERYYQTEELIELAINADRVTDVRWVSKLAHDLFRHAIVALRMSR